jgi:hypothetical protein
MRHIHTKNMTPAEYIESLRIAMEHAQQKLDEARSVWFAALTLHNMYEGVESAEERMCECAEQAEQE